MIDGFDNPDSGSRPGAMFGSRTVRAVALRGPGLMPIDARSLTMTSDNCEAARVDEVLVSNLISRVLAAFNAHTATVSLG